MFCCIDRKDEQKELYFDLDRVFKISYEHKISGIYVLYKDNICLYVGQSKNIASRIATHLSGKYKNIDKILVFNDDEHYDDEDNVDVLDYSEKFAFKIFKPIENLLVDFTEDIDTNCIIRKFYDFNSGYPLFNTFEIFLCESNIFISDDQIMLNLKENERMKKEIFYCISMAGKI